VSNWKKGELPTEWGELVAHLLGPKMPSDDPEQRRKDARQLAKAALLAAGEIELAKSIKGG
jgi:hypothetical protein